MDNRDILMLLLSYLDNSSLEKLSHTTLWLIIREFANYQHFWYLRTQVLVGRELSTSSECWKTAYYLLERAIQEENPFSEGEFLTNWNRFVQNQLTIDVLSNELVVKILLELEYDPSVDDSWSIRCSSENGHTEVVRLLLKSSRADPSSEDNSSIRNSSRNGHTEVVRLLLNDSRVDPSSDDNQAIIQACNNGHIEVVRLLLQDKRVTSEDEENRIGLVKVLLALGQ